MVWVYLVAAGILEIVWAYYMKQSAGFTRVTPTVITLVAMIASFWLLSLSMRALPLGTAYAIWTGIGIVGTAVLGIFLFQESADPIRLACIGLIIAGIAGLKLTTA